MSNQSKLLARRDLSIEVAKAAGKMARDALAKLKSGELKVQEKGPQDFVTEVDRNVERFIREQLQAEFPNDTVIGEELGRDPHLDITWVVDPIDGTANYVRGLPHWSVSIAMVSDGRVVSGVVYDAIEDATYHGFENIGAYRDREPIRSTQPGSTSSSLAILGSSPKSNFSDHLALLEHLYNANTEARRFGSAALGLAYVSAGLADVYYEAVLNCWDVFAGALIAQEAGALVLMPDFDEFLRRPGPVLCGTSELVELIYPKLPLAERSDLTAWGRNVG